MVLLQPRLNLKVSQKQILTPGLVQMVSVLALNKLELKDMITAEMVENPVLEELDPTVPLIDDVAAREEARDRDTSPAAAEEADPVFKGKDDPFEQIDFGSFFQEYLDPGYRTNSEIESVERPSFENFLSKPSTLTDHLMWQLGAIHTTEPVRIAAELVIGNLNDDGYLTATEDELMQQAHLDYRAPSPVEQAMVTETGDQPETKIVVGDGESAEAAEVLLGLRNNGDGSFESSAEAGEEASEESHHTTVAVADEPAPLVADAPIEVPAPVNPNTDLDAGAMFTRVDLRQAIDIVRQMDPIGVAASDVRGCLMAQLLYHKKLRDETGVNGTTEEILNDSIQIVDKHLRAVQNKQFKEISKAIGRPLEAIQAALEYVRTLDPKPGLRYNQVQPRLIEPDVAFIKQGDEYIVVLNDDDVPQLRLNTSYKRLLNRDAAEKDVRAYVKDRYKSAIQLIKNIEQRKQTIMKVCYAIVGRQRDFLDQGIDQLKPMMIKEVAEEIGVHPSTVSRAVANKYAHTAQGVFELRYFFSESVQGPEGGNTSLLILKRRVKKLIDEEDPARPLTDEQITRILQSQGIQVTRRTVAKYREDMKIPSTHQRRVKN
ncbi:MAG TPA: RNA polymerase factor sigma-54 [Terriglobales bacterium]|nr:RNA polymerase factor sigma-54 [Terriglobales bacterium]